MNKRIGNNLKKIRSISSFTQEEVAAALGINRSAYSKYECGNQGMPVDLLEKTADLFGCELYVFFEESSLKTFFLLQHCVLMNSIATTCKRLFISKIS